MFVTCDVCDMRCRRACPSHTSQKICNCGSNIIHWSFSYLNTDPWFKLIHNDKSEAWFLSYLFTTLSFELSLNWISGIPKIPPTGSQIFNNVDTLVSYKTIEVLKHTVIICVWFKMGAGFPHIITGCWQMSCTFVIENMVSATTVNRNMWAKLVETWVMEKCISDMNQLWFRKWLDACLAPSHYPNQCWLNINWTPGNKCL